MPVPLTWIKQKKLPLFWLLTIPFTGLTIIGMGLMHVLSIQHSQEVALEAASLLTEQVSQNIQVQLEDYLEKPHLLQQGYIRTFQQGLVNTEDFDQILNFFSRQSEFLEPTIGTIAFANLEGEFVGANHSEKYLVLANSETNRAIQRYFIDENKKPGSLISQSPNYDARKRNWYKMAIEAGQPTFTDIEASVTRKRLDVTAVSPYFDQEGTLQGVFLTDLSLKNISQFLASLNIAKTGIAFITEHDGLLVANSTPEVPFTLSLETEEPVRLAAENSANPLIQAAAQNLSKKFDDGSTTQKDTQLIFQLQGERYILHCTSWENQKGIDWLITVIIPEKDFLGQVEIHNFKNLTVSMLVAGMVLIVGIIMARSYTAPLLLLSKMSQKIAAGNLDQVVPLPLSRELQILVSSFNQMTAQLKSSFSTLENRVEERTLKLAQLNQKLQRLAITDSLTQTRNRGYFDSQIQVIWEAAKQEQKAISLIVCDIDHFKIYNDTYGHPQGDRCIQAVAQVLLETAKPFNGLVCRYGGEEFTIVLQDEAASKAKELAENIQANLKQKSILYGVAKEQRVTISLGIATFIPSPRNTIQGMINAADKALYRAKAKGRNCYCIHREESII